MPAGEVTVRLNLNKDGYSAGMTAARKQAQEFEKSVKDAGQHTVSQMQAASASIRLIEGDMQRNVRAVEKFITTIPGVGAALKAAFPLVGAAATVGILVRIGEEAYNAVQKVRQMGSAIQAGMESITSSGKLANDEMALTNARLQEEIDKLEHKPGNGLAAALAEAQVNADKLFDSLRRDNEEIAKVLNANQSGLLAQVMGHAPSKEVNQAIQQQMTGLENTGRAARDATTPAARDAANARLRDQLQAAVKQMEQLKLQNPNATVGGQDFSNNFNAIDATESVIKQRLDAMRLADQNQKEQQQKAADEKVKQQQEDAKKAAAAMKAAQGQIVEQWQRALDQAKAYTTITVDQEAAYWDYRASTATKGSLSYLKALDEANKAIARINADTMSLRKSTGKKQDTFNDTSSDLHIDRFDLSRSDTGEMKNQGNEAAEYLRNLNQQIVLQRQNASAIAETSLQMALMTGQISKLDAAQAIAALHAEQFNQEMKAIADAMAAAQQLPEGLERSQRIAGLKGTQIQTQGQRQVQLAGDQQGITDNTISGAVKQSLNQMVQSFTDMATQLKEIIPRAVDGLNDDLAKTITGHGSKADFGRTLSQTGQGLVKAGLQNAEGQALKLFGLGGAVKADGSKANPYYVKMAEGGIGGGGSIGGGDDDSQAPGFSGLLGKFIQPFVGTAGKFLPHFAEGGPVAAGQAIWTGENGPEPFIPKTAGTIIPNHALGGNSTTIHVDARGSNDPAAIHAAVMRAAPHIAAAAVQTSHSRAQRTPHGR